MCGSDGRREKGGGEGMVLRGLDRSSLAGVVRSGLAGVVRSVEPFGSDKV